MRQVLLTLIGVLILLSCKPDRNVSKSVEKEVDEVNESVGVQKNSEPDVCIISKAEVDLFLVVGTHFDLSDELYNCVVQCELGFRESRSRYSKDGEWGKKSVRVRTKLKRNNCLKELLESHESEVKLNDLISFIQKVKG